MMMEQPRILLLLLLIIPVTLIWGFRYRRGKRDLLALGGEWRFKRLLDAYLFKSFFSFLSFLLFFICVALALAGFRWGYTLEEEKRAGQELVFLLDVSHSMLASDLKPTRLKQACLTIQDMIEELDHTSFALVVYKGEAVKLIPLTEDDYALETFLNHVTPDIITSPGSDLERGIEAALSVFSDNQGRYRAVVLFTDGEYHSGNPASPAARAGKTGIPIFIGAAGTEEGAMITLSGGSPVLDESGNPVISKLRPQALEKIARLSGGKVFRLSAGPSGQGGPAAALISSLTEAREENLVLGFRRVKKERYRLFLFIGMIFLSISIIIRAIRWKNIL